MEENSSFFSRAPAPEVGNCCVIPECALRPLVGEASQFLRALKIDLLDMDDAIPEAALRPSKGHLERRWAWRTYVKSAETIYEVLMALQAAALLPSAFAIPKVGKSSVSLKDSFLFGISLSDHVKVESSSSALRFKVVAFATFVNHQSAMAALHSLNGVKFDPQTGSVLHIEMARSNSRRKRKPGSGAYVVIDKRTKTTADAQETSSDDDSGASESDEPSGANQSDSGDKSELAVAKSGETVGGAENIVAAENEQTEKTVDGVSPCSTLFIANLGPNCTEDELKQFLSQYTGFKVLKVRARGGMPVAFADFEDVEQATIAMGALQGSSIPSSDRGGMHIEYARSKMRKS